MRRTARIFLMFVVSGATLAWLPVEARASETFADVVRTRWKVPNGRLPVPGEGCRLCHDSDAGGLDNVRTYFGLRIRDTYRVTRRRDDLLQRALDSIQSNRDDSDRDGISDYEEVAEDGTNPNDPRSRRPPDTVPSEGGAGGEDGSGGAVGEGGSTGEPSLPPLPPLPELPPPLAHGCSVTTRSSRDPWVGLGALGAVLGVAARRRRRHP